MVNDFKDLHIEILLCGKASSVISWGYPPEMQSAKIPCWIHPPILQFQRVENRCNLWKSCSCISKKLSRQCCQLDKKISKKQFPAIQWFCCNFKRHTLWYALSGPQEQLSSWWNIGCPSWDCLIVSHAKKSGLLFEALRLYWILLDSIGLSTVTFAFTQLVVDSAAVSSCRCCTPFGACPLHPAVLRRVHRLGCPSSTAWLLLGFRMNVLMHISLHRILVVIFHPPCRCNETEILKEKMKIPHHVSPMSRSRLSPIKKTEVMAELPRQRTSSRLRQSEVAWRGMHQVYKRTMTNFAQNWRGSQRIHEPSDRIQCLGYLYYWHPHSGSPEISRDVLSKYLKILEIKCYTVPLGWMVQMFQHGWWKWNKIRWDSSILHPVVEQHTLDFLCQNHWVVLNPNIQLVGLWLKNDQNSM